MKIYLNNHCDCIFIIFNEIYLFVYTTKHDDLAENISVLISASVPDVMKIYHKCLLKRT